MSRLCRALLEVGTDMNRNGLSFLSREVSFAFRVPSRSLIWFNVVETLAISSSPITSRDGDILARSGLDEVKTEEDAENGFCAFGRLP